MAWFLQDRGEMGISELRAVCPTSQPPVPAGRHLFCILHGDYSFARVNPCTPVHSLLTREGRGPQTTGGGGNHGKRVLPTLASSTEIPQTRPFLPFSGGKNQVGSLNQDGGPEQECSLHREELLASVYPSVKWGKGFLTLRLPRGELPETK